MGNDSTVYELTLYVAGSTGPAARALENVKLFFEEVVREPYKLEIVDVLERPEMAEEAYVLATPTLILEGPPPERRIIGDFSDREKLGSALGIQPRGNDRALPGGGVMGNNFGPPTGCWKQSGLPRNCLPVNWLLKPLHRRPGQATGPPAGTF